MSIPHFVYAYICKSTHSYICPASHPPMHLQILAIMNNGASNVGMQISYGAFASNSFSIETFFHTIYFGHAFPFLQLLPNSPQLPAHLTSCPLLSLKSKQKQKPKGTHKKLHEKHKMTYTSTRLTIKTENVQAKQNETNSLQNCHCLCFVLANYSWVRSG